MFRTVMSFERGGWIVRLFRGNLQIAEMSYGEWLKLGAVQKAIDDIVNDRWEEPEEDLPEWTKGAPGR